MEILPQVKDTSSGVLTYRKFSDSKQNLGKRLGKEIVLDTVII